jgi:hypothetical protein
MLILISSINFSYIYVPAISGLKTFNIFFIHKNVEICCFIRPQSYEDTGTVIKAWLSFKKYLKISAEAYVSSAYGLDSSRRAGTGNPENQT